MVYSKQTINHESYFDFGCLSLENSTKKLFPIQFANQLSH